MRLIGLGVSGFDAPPAQLLLPGAEKAAGRKAPKLRSDAERVAFLFERYQALASLLPGAKPARRRAVRRTEGAV